MPRRKKKDSGIVIQLPCLEENERGWDARGRTRPAGCQIRVDVLMEHGDDGLAVKFSKPVFVHNCWKHDIDWVVDQGVKVMKILAKAQKQGERLDRKQRKQTVAVWEEESDGVWPWWFMAHGVTAEQMGDIYSAAHEIVGDE